MSSYSQKVTLFFCRILFYRRPIPSSLLYDFVFHRFTSLPSFSSSTDIARFIALCFIVVHRCCIFYKSKAQPCTRKKIMTYFIAVVWNRIHNLFEVCVCVVSFLSSHKHVLVLFILKEKKVP